MAGILAGLALLTVGPAVAGAHEVTGSRFDAPLPLSVLYLGAGGAVAATALVRAVRDRPTVSTEPVRIATIDDRTIRRLRAATAVAFFLAVGAALVVGVLGRQAPAENVATVFTWPVWVHGVALVAILIGSPWRTISPWRTVYRGLCHLEGGRVAVLDRYPAWLGSWPAVAGFVLLVGIVEPLTVIPRSPAATSAVVAVYALVMLAGAVLVGPTWFARADPLGVLYRLFGRVACVTTDRTTDGTEIAVCPPWQGCVSPVSDPALVAFVVAAVYTVSFDVLTSTAPYRTILVAVSRALATGPWTPILLYGFGLGGFLLTFLVTILIGQRLAAPAVDRGSSTGFGQLARAFAPTVLPIAAAYEVAHTYPYVIRSTARLLELVVGSVGVDVGPLDPFGWLPLPLFWGSQVALIVVGHVVAVVAAHRVAVDRYPTDSAARRGHLPLVVLMIGYTVLSLWLISRPVVTG